MSIVAARQMLHQLVQPYGDPLQPPAPNQLLLQVRTPDRLAELAKHLSQEKFYLVTAVANDERELEDNCFKLYYVFSHPSEDLFLLAEYLLQPTERSYPSIHPFFAAAEPFEREIYSLFGLSPAGSRADHISALDWAHLPYPADLHPLHRSRTTAELKQMATAAFARQNGQASAELPQPRLGSLFLPVGPVHAGIIEPGRFVFQIAGEVIDGLNIQLGYTHKGLERLFQTRLTLADGWRLAEQVAGDSPFAHSLAYCQAAENLAGVEAPPAAQLLRGLWLELERIYNHVGDVAALAHDVSADWISSELAVVRERLLRLNAAATDHRFLRALNRPGGVSLPKQRLPEKQWGYLLNAYVEQFNRLADTLSRTDAFRDRAITTGTLTYEDALKLGTTGLIARASGLERDYRRAHPWGVYRQPWLQELLSHLEELKHTPTPGYLPELSNGDVYARFLTRLQEVKNSTAIINEILAHWANLSLAEQNATLTDIQFDPAHNFTFAVGYAEGWRGDIIYWLMQDKLGRIYRCKVRDPSMLNWPALRQAIIPHAVADKMVDTILPDFPLINKSFNLSYSGNDL